ncbi:MAG: 16S rRNA (guanine(966)-N(2))-methyltransferase RsmD [Proteobacteria bacterium]|nr:16S rRNA (guanine(966)-N(2))-methyltransferase RsmD [Pseudomonadota bacterium]MBU1386443.1 16S rRNA (guanine(966)-N(2))-methyltransferase RsmD [Pseudomonadota bacterium]MBU1544554.1 16S rRNA (guanine(966)-N(2))-methyltransferase RsmD [Pseudomonadota bacterium]MBU2482755.1 16S rRNA (guanine(966)-N(2))-methyltransferase RsmD [Pseudomonadota bacterium]
MRVIGGKYRGRKLVQIYGTKIRPTSDRIREAVFNILGPKIKNRQVLDLFAGTGALGIEALSRGAQHCTFADQDCKTVSQNVRHCGLEEKTRIICCDVLDHNFIHTLGSWKFNLIFMDPPYEKGYIESIFSNSSFLNIIDSDCILIFEQSHKENLDFLPPILDIYRQKKYSKTLISFIRKL